MWQPLGDRFHEKRRTLPEIPWTIAVGDSWRSRCRSQPLAIGMFLCDPSSKCQIASSLFLTPTLMDLGACHFDIPMVSATCRSPMQPPESASRHRHSLPPTAPEQTLLSLYAAVRHVHRQFVSSFRMATFLCVRGAICMRQQFPE